jgi:tetratricopeptide (TPR) repeat protein
MIGSEVALANQAYDDALVLIERTIESTRTLGILPFLTHLLFLKGEALLGLNRKDEAREVLLEALAESDTQGTPQNFQRLEALAALSKIETEQGHAAEAQELRQQAREILQFIADSLDQSDIRANFLAGPKIRAIMEE